MLFYLPIRVPNHGFGWIGVECALVTGERVVRVAQRSVEILVGKLLTDEAFREAFLMDPSPALQVFHEAGHELTKFEIAALLAAPAEFWKDVAREIDPRLQKANLAKEKT